MMTKAIIAGEVLAAFAVMYWISGTPENSVIAPPPPFLVVVISLALGVFLAFPLAVTGNIVRYFRNRSRRRELNGNQNEAR